MAHRYSLTPGGAKAKKLVQAYMESVIDEYEALRSEDANQTNVLTTLQAAKEAKYQMLGVEDLLVMVKNEALLAEWKAKHIERAQYELRLAIRELGLDEKTCDNLEQRQQQLLSRLSQLDQSIPPSIPDEELEEIVESVKSLLRQMPEIAAKVFETLSFEDLEKNFAQKCNQLHQVIIDVGERVKEEALTELEERRLSPAQWQKLASQLERIDAPEAALARQEDIDQLEEELRSAQSENNSLISENDEQGQRIEELIVQVQEHELALK